MRMNITIALVAAMMFAGLAFAQTPTTTTAPAGVDVPQETIKEMAQLFRRPAGTPEEQQKALTENMEKVLALGAAAEQKYPNATNLSMIHRIMLQAADFLVKSKKDDASRKQLNDLVDRILKSNVDLDAKVTADFVRTMHKAIGDDGLPTADAKKEIEAFVGRYKDGKAAPNAYSFAAGLADMSGQKDIYKDYVKLLKDKYLTNPSVRNYLRRIKEYSDVGQPFKVTLTKLDGTKLNLPGDLKGKVIVVDFWATWCPPCRESIPEIVALYKKYKDKGVEVIGISLDQTKEDAEKYAKDNDMTYIQTFDGRSNPTAIEYGIEYIPAVFVIGKDGKLLSTTARQNLEETVEKALGIGTTTTTAPAEK